jgi:hypothetical protein
MSGCSWRRTARVAGLLPVALMCLLSPAHVEAQSADRPVLLPTRDVAAIYQVSGSVPMDGAQKLQITYTKAGERTRVDYFRWIEAKYPYMAVIFDRPADRVTAIMAERRAYVERPVAKTENPAAFLRPGMRFTRQGTATVANIACTEWKVRPADKDEDAGAACVTDDGLMLRLTAAKASDASLTAIAVVYGSPPDGVFEPPAEFERRTPR